MVDLDANGEVSRDELHTHLSNHGQVDTSWTDSKLDEVLMQLWPLCVYICIIDAY